RRVVILLVEVVDVDVVGAESLQRVVDRPHDPAPRQAAAAGVARHRVGDLRGEHPVPALGGYQAAGDPLGFAQAVDVGGVDEVDAAVAGDGQDGARLLLVGAVAEHHRADAERGHLQAAAAEPAVSAVVVHGFSYNGERAPGPCAGPAGTCSGNVNRPGPPPGTGNRLPGQAT